MQYLFFAGFKPIFKSLAVSELGDTLELLSELFVQFIDVSPIGMTYVVVQQVLLTEHPDFYLMGCSLLNSNRLENWNLRNIHLLLRYQLRLPKPVIHWSVNLVFCRDIPVPLWALRIEKYRWSPVLFRDIFMKYLPLVVIHNSPRAYLLLNELLSWWFSFKEFEGTFEPGAQRVWDVDCTLIAY